MSFKPSVVRAFNSFDVRSHSDLFGIVFDEPSLTDQSQAQDADINVLVRRWLRTGVMPQTRSVGSYGDFTSVDDYQSALEAVRDAESAFLELPADVRRSFGNDPAALLRALDDPSQHAELVRLGVLAKPQAAEPALDKSLDPSYDASASTKDDLQGTKS